MHLTDKVERLSSAVVSYGRKAQSFAQAKASYDKLLKQKEPDDIVLIMSCSLGDVVYGMSYVSALKESCPERNIILIADKKTAPIVNSYASYDRVEYFDKDDKWGKRYLLVLNASKHYANRGLKDGIINTIPHVRHGIMESDCLTLLRKDFRLPVSAQIDYPKPCLDNKVRAIPNFVAKREHIAVVNPYAACSNVCKIEKELSGLAQYLKGKGYEVYSNLVGNQKPISGTLPLHCSIEEFYAIADQVPLIVSVRTGLIDWVNNTSSKKVVLYSADTNDDYFRFYSLACWKQTNIYEYRLKNADGNTTKLIEAALH